MNESADIPHEPLVLNYSNGGFLPHIGLHRHGQLFYQESSYSHFWLMGIMLVAAGIVVMLPLDIVALGGVKLKYWVAAGLLFGGVCGFVPYFTRNAFGQTIIIDPQERTLTIREGTGLQTMAWSQIVALQICHEKAPRGSELTGYQLNLAWRHPDGKIRRHCLQKHAIKRFIVSLGKKYESLLGFRLLDETEAGCGSNRSQ